MVTLLIILEGSELGVGGKDMRDAASIYCSMGFPPPVWTALIFPCWDGELQVPVDGECEETSWGRMPAIRILREQMLTKYLAM